MTRYTAAFHEVPAAWAPYAYDSVVLLATAAGKAGGFDEAPLRSALQSARGWRGWTGSVSFDNSTGNRQPAPVVVLSTRDDGTLHVDDAWSTVTGFRF